MSNVLAFKQRPVEAKPAVRGFALLHRKITELPFYKTDSQAVHLWTHIILMANFQPSIAATEYGDMMLKRGEFITGRNTLASETGIDPNRVQYLLRKFKKLGMIETKSPGKFTVITVTKYEEYQGEFRAENTPKTVPEDYQKITRANPDVARAEEAVVPEDYQIITTDKQYINNTVLSNDNTGASAAKKSEPKKPAISCEDVLSAYHEILPEAPRVRVLTDKRRNQIRTFWKAANKAARQLDDHAFTLDDWKTYLGYIANNCRWMLEDRANARTGNTWRKKSFEWYLNPNTYVAVREGVHDDR